MRTRLVSALALLVLTIGAAAAAERRQEQPAQPAVQANAPTGVDRIQSFIGDKTIAVARVDLSQLDLQGSERWLAEFVRAVAPNAQQQRQQLDQLSKQMQATRDWVQRARQAGVSRIFAVLKAPPQGRAQWAVIVPLDPNQDAQAVEQLMTPKPPPNAAHPMMQLQTEKIRDAIVLAPANLVNELRQPAQGQPQGVEQAMKAVDDSAIQLALLPTERLTQMCQQLAEQNAQRLPQGVTVEDLKSIPTKMDWVVLGINTPPRQSLKVIADAQSAPAARDIGDTINKLMTSAKRNKDLEKYVDDPSRLIQAVTPRVEGERLTLTLGGQELDRLVQQDLAQALRRATGQEPIRATEIPAEEPVEQEPPTPPAQPQAPQQPQHQR